MMHNAPKVRRLTDRVRSLLERFRWPGGRPPHMGGAVPACVVGCGPPALMDPLTLL